MALPSLSDSDDSDSDSAPVRPIHMSLASAKGGDDDSDNEPVKAAAKAAVPAPKVSALSRAWDPEDITTKGEEGLGGSGGELPALDSFERDLAVARARARGGNGSLHVRRSHGGTAIALAPVHGLVPRLASPGT